MLRIHFGDADLARTRVAAEPDPLWEIALSLHRFQTRQGRWAVANWHHAARRRLHEKGLDRVVRTLLLPLFPRAAYYPDFLNPAAASQGLRAGLAAIVDTSAAQVRHEVERLARVTAAPVWVRGLVDRQQREELSRHLRAYYDAAIAPNRDEMTARIDADRSMLGRALLGAGVEGLLDGLRPLMRRQGSVLHVDYPVEDRDLHLDGRGLQLVPSYFCWRTPMALADSELPPVLVFPLRHETPMPRTPDGAPLTVLLGRTRAHLLRAVAAGATTGELARAAGVSASSASRHANALRDAGLISSHRRGTTVLHTLTPLGAALLRGSTTETPNPL